MKKQAKLLKSLKAELAHLQKYHGLDDSYTAREEYLINKIDLIEQSLKAAKPVVNKFHVGMLKASITALMNAVEKDTRTPVVIRQAAITVSLAARLGVKLKDIMTEKELYLCQAVINSIFNRMTISSNHWALVMLVKEQLATCAKWVIELIKPLVLLPKLPALR